MYTVISIAQVKTGLHLEPNINVLFGDTLNNAKSTHNTERLLWQPSRAALRAGTTDDGSNSS